MEIMNLHLLPLKTEILPMRPGRITVHARFSVLRAFRIFKRKTLSLFGEFYREDVLKNPEGMIIRISEIS
jgi:hypothetical protein